jgi:hypothetical protein
MPTTNHGDIELVGGDAWCIVGTLLDKGGNPLDLTNASIAWTLLDPSGTPVRIPRAITATILTAGALSERAAGSDCKRLVRRALVEAEGLCQLAENAMRKDWLEC